MLGLEFGGISCVITLSAPTNLFSLSQSNPDLYLPNKPVFKLLGGTLKENRELAIEASLLTLVTEKAPPFFIAHGDQDSTIHIDQSKQMYEKLKTYKATSVLKIIAGGTHKLRSKDLTDQIHLFLEERLISVSGRN